MRSKLLVADFAVTGNSTSYSTAVVLTGASSGYGAEGVPGEDMAFPSSGNAVVALVLENVSFATSIGSIQVQVSNNLFAGGSGATGVTYSTVATYSAAVSGPAYKTVFLDKVPLGESMRLAIVSGHTSDSGNVTAYLLSN